MGSVFMGAVQSMGATLRIMSYNKVGFTGFMTWPGTCAFGFSSGGSWSQVYEVTFFKAISQ